MEKTMDLKITGAKVYNSYFKTFAPADVYVLEGRFAYVDEDKSAALPAQETLDAAGLYMTPGLIDIHMHIESSMLTPYAFSRHMGRCGVTTIVSEPHEMANVNGIDGILDMIKAGKGSPIDILYGIPSSVPSTSAALETTGGAITCKEMQRLKEEPAVVCVGEVMNYRQVIADNDLEIGRFLAWLRRHDPIFPVEGHCPQLTGLDLAKFLYLGINGDHTEHNLEELRQRFAMGMFVEIQDKMLNRQVLDFIKQHELYEHFCLVTDDVMTDVLHEEGQLDALVRKAVGLGLPPQKTLYNASYTPARRMNLTDRGSIAPGKLADFVLVKNPAHFRAEATYKRGRCIYEKGVEQPWQDQLSAFPRGYYHSVRPAPPVAQQFAVPAPPGCRTVQVRAIEVRDGSTQTREQIITLPVEDGLVQWQGSGCLLAMVMERYGKGGGIGYGFLTGACHHSGAVATTYAHDCHNLLVAGANAEDMLLAARRVVDWQGGFVAAENGQVLAGLPLPIGGILSDRPVEEAGPALAAVRRAMQQLGYRHYNPIMSFATLTLPVSPQLKLTDKGMIDVTAGQVLPLFVG